tara:strand:+ start:261 stop:995 length:735 start_codon:yes stop_codon:yes gene_type:complete
MESSNFIPEGIRSEEFWVKTNEIIDDLVTLEEAKLKEIVEKYKDISVQVDEVYERTIDEMGYEYIRDVLKLSSDELRVMRSYMNLIHFLKGHKSGLELVLNIMNITYYIREWWEHVEDAASQDSYKIPDTFTMEFSANTAKVYPETNARLRTFVRHYVYPQLADLITGYSWWDAINEIQVGGFSDTTIYSSFGSPINTQGVGLHDIHSIGTATGDIANYMSALIANPIIIRPDKIHTGVATAAI